MRGRKWSLLGLLVCCLLRGGHSQMNSTNGTACQNNNSLFLPKFQLPIPWWVVQPADVPGVANTALTLRSALTTSNEDFAQQIIIAVARNQTIAIAKSIGYMINANATLGGGCPVPPPPTAFLNQVGEGLAATVEYGSDLESLFGGQTEAQLNIPQGSLAAVNGSMITDTVLGAMFIAGRSCGPPNALSSSTLAAIEEKYVESVCYYAGPIFRSVTDNNTIEIPCYNSTFESDIVLANQTDVYVSGPLLAAYKQCVVGPISLLDPPPWLNYSFGPVVSIDSSGGGNSVALDSIDTGDTGTGAASADDTSASSAQSASTASQETTSLDGGRRRHN